MPLEKGLYVSTVPKSFPKSRHLLAGQILLNTGFRNWKRAVEKFSTHAKSHSHVHAVTVYAHGTQDISGEEQESVCLRYVDHDLIPHEGFIGFYSVTESTE